MAIDGKLPILPVVFSSYKTFMDDKKKSLNSGRVIITALPPISTQGMTKDDLDGLLAGTYEAMSTVYQQTSGEVAELHKITQEQTKSQANGPSRSSILLGDNSLFNRYNFFMPPQPQAPSAPAN